MTVFTYIRHFGPVILMLCMMTSETGLLGEDDDSKLKGN